jgi:hypothetical protein
VAPSHTTHKKLLGFATTTNALPLLVEVGTNLPIRLSALYHVAFVLNRKNMFCLYGTRAHVCRCNDSVTNEDGRCPGLMTQETFLAGTYLIRFEVASYFEATERDSFYP